MPRRRPNYDRKLSRRIVLDDGTQIMTLRGCHEPVRHAVRDHQKLAAALRTRSSY